ncbi:TetR family transcriptional regulator [Neobacillus soli]|uniref:TetR family transcriptional regulator n=1 Tax=Neobacillus soli TaxID=220688 RepID=UPI000824B43C|nr:TetR family transcriptional regulator [Neobacillus soli]
MPKVSDEHKELRIQQILLAASEVFKSKGYEQATLKDIVEEAGMSRGWIYLYFKDKTTIFMALIDYLDAQLEERISTLLKENKGSAHGVLISYFQETSQSIDRLKDSVVPAIYEFCTTGWRVQQVRDYFVNRYIRVTAIFIDVIGKGVENGEFKPTRSVDEIGKYMISSLDGIMLHSLAFGSQQINAVQQVNLLINQLMEMLSVNFLKIMGKNS